MPKGESNRVHETLRARQVVLKIHKLGDENWLLIDRGI